MERRDKYAENAVNVLFDEFEQMGITPANDIDRRAVRISIKVLIMDAIRDAKTNEVD